MNKALILLLILVVGLVASGCGDQHQTQADAQTKGQGARNPDGSKSDGNGGKSVNAEN